MRIYREKAEIGMQREEGWRGIEMGKGERRIGIGRERGVDREGVEERTGTE